MLGLSEPLTFTVNFPAHILETAHRFQQQQRSPQKAAQVYLNTLSVYAVQFYCECMGIDADLSQGDSWDPTMQTLLDTADLILPEGTLECRPILPDAQACDVPTEVQSDRSGYVVVEVDSDANEATLVGFAKTAETGVLHRSELQSLDGLIDEIIDAEPAVSPVQTVTETVIETVDNLSAKLNDWLNDRFEDLWQPPGMVLTPSYRGARSDERSTQSSERAKRLQIGPFSVVLTVQVDRVEGDARSLAILLKVYPDGTRTLPAGLMLELLDDELDVAMSTTAGSTDNFRALSFEIETEEVFAIRIAVGTESVTERFIS